MNAALESLDMTETPRERFRRVVAEDLLALAMLHDKEMDRDLLMSLWSSCYEDFLGLVLRGSRATEALGILREGLTEIPTELCQETLDRLASDYADIYLTHSLRASPYESVWLDDENLAMQAPMFAVRDWYRRYGIAVEDWRKRSDDHLVHELRFLSHLLVGDEQSDSAPLEDAARFMDEHPLRWIDGFASRVAGRCQFRLYAGVALLTAAYLDELRDLLAELLEVPRPTAQEMDARMKGRMPGPVEVEAPFVPGVAPSW